MTTIKVEIQDRELRAAVDRLAELGQEPQPLLEALGNRLETNVKLCFQTGTDPYGRKWEPLKVRPGQPLRDKGHLMNSITHDVEGESVVVGTNRQHMHVQQFGATIRAKPGKSLVFTLPDGTLIFRKSVTIPSRMFLPTDGLPLDWQDDLREETRELLGDAWGGEAG